MIAVDLSTGMLAEARKRAARGRRLRPDHVRRSTTCATTSRPHPVALVTIPYRSFLHMATTEDQLACLASVNRSLVPGGRLILNMFVPGPGVRRRTGPPSQPPRRVHRRAGPPLRAVGDTASTRSPHRTSRSERSSRRTTASGSSRATSPRCTSGWSTATRWSTSSRAPDSRWRPYMVTSTSVR